MPNYATVCPPAAGRETRCPGSCQRCRPGQLVYVSDQLSNRRFLVDTGAAYSIFRHHSSGQPTGTGPSLAGPDGPPLACWGDKPVQLLLDGCRFQWTFLLAAVQCPIIGVDFLRAHHLLVDPFQQQAVGLVYVKVSESQPRQASAQLFWFLLCGQDGGGLCSHR